MFKKYPAKLETLVNSSIVADKNFIIISGLIEDYYEDKLYVLYGNILIRECLVFDDNILIDSYSILPSGEYYKGKTFSEWMGILPSEQND